MLFFSDEYENIVGFEIGVIDRQSINSDVVAKFITEKGLVDHGVRYDVFSTSKNGEVLVEVITESHYLVLTDTDAKEFLRIVKDVFLRAIKRVHNENEELKRVVSALE
tara:strand:- start:156 stop:479 length:324 start_codon:yes stop_codon:yes gene_type:complete